MIGAPLSDEQIRATLERHGYHAETNVIGISYSADHRIVTVNVYGAQLLVPTDILERRPAPERFLG